MKILMYQAKANAILQASLERRKQALHNRRLAVEQEVSIIHIYMHLLWVFSSTVVIELRPEYSEYQVL
jgi:hypothetical protein